MNNLTAYTLIATLCLCAYTLIDSYHVQAHAVGQNAIIEGLKKELELEKACRAHAEYGDLITYAEDICGKKISF